MAQQVAVPNFRSLNILARTVFADDIIIGSDSLTVQNSTDFANGGPVLLGNIGSETAELLSCSTPPDAVTLPLESPTTLSHNAAETVLLLYGDQLRIYSAPDLYRTGKQPPDDTFSLISTGTIPIDGSKENTAF